MTLHRHPLVELLSSETPFRGRIFDVVRESLRLPSGLRQNIAVVDHPGAVAVAAVDEHGDMLLVRQYRHAVGDWLVEVPAGRLESGEDPLDAARRELEEETGHSARDWQLLCEFFAAPGFCSERMSVFTARAIAPVASPTRRPDADEELELLRAPPLEVARGEIALATGERVRIVDAKTLIAAARLCALGRRERER
jgi:ADP-ribose pyrophosphatase